MHVSVTTVVDAGRVVCIAPAHALGGDPDGFEPGGGMRPER